MKIFRTIDIDERRKARERERLNRERRAEHVGIYPTERERQAMRETPKTMAPDEARSIAQAAIANGLLKKTKRPTLADLRKEGIIP